MYNIVENEDVTTAYKEQLRNMNKDETSSTEDNKTNE
jgi:hypothetical protein